MKKLLFTASTLPRFPSDSEPRFVLDLAHALSDRYDVTILAPSAPNAQLLEQDGPVTIQRYRYAPFRFMERLAYPGAIMPRLRRHPWLWLTVPMLFFGLYFSLHRLLQQKFDLVHCHWLIPQGLVQALGFSGSNMPPFVATGLGGDLTIFNGPLGRFLFRPVFERAAEITVISESLRTVLGTRRTDASVIPMGVDVKKFHPRLAVPGYFSRWCGEQPVLLFVGRLVEKKGLRVLLQAMAEPVVQLTGAHLVIVGDGPLKQKLEDYRDVLNLRKKVHFVPAVMHTELASMYASADVLCVPSIVAANGDTEGMPTVILEASASETPSVATSVGGITEFIIDGVNGLVIAPDDAASLAGAIARLLNSPVLRERLGRAALQSVAAYDWSQIAKRFDTLYKSVLRSHDAVT